MADFNDQLRRTLNLEVVRRLLVRYFLVDKGIDSIDSLIYPPIIASLPFDIPELSAYVEVIPHTDRVDPIHDTAELGWNLFVLGNHRQFLGKTYHVGLVNLASQIYNNCIDNNGIATNQTTPRRIIHFIMKTLGSHSGGYVNLDASNNPSDLLTMGIHNSMNATSLYNSGQFNNF